MDIALKFKRVLATVATVAIFATNASVAIAQTFTDVPTDAWYYDYVEQLADDGLLDTSTGTYRPNDALNRAELVKLVVTAVEGLAGYEAPATPTFDDVSTDAWYYQYVEAAVQLGIVNGYTDAQGNLTGKFGPGDTVNRAAATKILVNAFSVPTDLMPAPAFPDVKSGDWFYDYVATAYNQSVLDGYANGYFGPADPVTRAQVAKLIVNSQNPVERVVGEGEGEGEGEGTSEGALEVSLNDETPASSTLPRAASSVDLLSFDLTAADDAVNVTQIVVTRGGVGQTSDWDALYLYEGTKRLTTGRTLNSDTNTATFPVSLTIDAGTTTTLRLVGDVAAAPGGSNQHYFYVASAADVTSNAQSVAGDFPTVGNTFTMGGAGTTVNTLTVSAGTAPSQPQIGSLDSEIASVKMVAGATNDVAVHSAVFSNGGSLDSGKLVNCRLLRGTDEVATAEAFDGDRITFALGTPYVIPKGQTKTFYIRCDIDGGRTTDNVRIYLDENTDLTAIDQQYGYGAVITNTFNTAAQTNTLTLKGGTVTVTDNGPAATQIAQNTTNNEILNFALTVDRDLTVQNTFMQISLQDAAATAPTLPVANAGSVACTGAGVPAGCIAGSNVTTVETNVAEAGWSIGDMLSIPTAAGTEYRIITAVAGGGKTFTVATLSGVPNAATTEVNPYEYIRNVRLVDLDSGSTLAGPLTNATSSSTLVGGGTSYTKVHTEDYDLTGGETRHLSVQADINQNMAAGYQIRAAVRYSDAIGPASYLKDMAANEFVAMADIVGAGNAALAGKWMSTAANSLAVGLASTPTSNTYVRGDATVPGLGIALTAGDAGAITAKRLTVRVYGDTETAGAWGSVTGDLAANTLVSSVTIYDGADVVAGPKSLTLVDTAAAGFVADSGDYYKAQFDDLNIVIPKGGTKTLTAKVTLLNTMAATTFVALDINPNTDVLAEDADANTITPTPNALLNALVVAKHVPEMTVLTAGQLDAWVNSTPDVANLADGSTNQLVAKYKFKALREGFTVNKLTIVNDAAGEFGDVVVATGAVANVTVKYPDINGVTQSKSSSLSAGKATLAGLGFYVPAGQEVFLEVYADVASITGVGEGLSGQGFRLGLQNTLNTISTFEAVGASSSNTLNFNDANPSARVTLSGTVNPFVVRNVVPVFSAISYSQSMNNSAPIYGFTVTTDSAGGAKFARFVFDVTSNNAAVAYGNARLYTGASSSSAVALDNTKVFIYDVTNGVDLRGAAPVAYGAGTYKVVVAFYGEISENTVGANSTKAFILKGDVSGTATGQRLSANLAIGDESTPVTAILGTPVCSSGNDELCSKGNGNTGLIYDVAVNEALFTGASPSVAFTQTAPAGRNIIWSDSSAEAPYYPIVCTAAATPVAACTADGDVVQRTSAIPPRTQSGYDWTNGWALKVSSLASNSLAY